MEPIFLTVIDFVNVKLLFYI